jgi:hypothetical protein
MGSKRHRRQLKPEGGGKSIAIAPPPERVLLRRVHFMNNEKINGSVLDIIQLRIMKRAWNLVK